jgi:hypothetical protein
MRFLLKMAFWLGVVLVLLPGGGASDVPKGAQVSAIDAMSLATAAASDVRGFCERKPEACVTGSQVAVALGYRAQAGAKMLYEFLNEQLAPAETGSVGGTAAMPKLAEHPGQDTLTEADRGPEWRVPQPRRDPRAS